jgi:hypothetical protein
MFNIFPKLGCARGIWLVLVFCVAVVACTGKKTYERSNFVGKWQSSKLATPLFLYDNGEWEIKKDDGGILQYGIWEYQDGAIIWRVKLGSRIEKDVNTVISVSPREFRLQERQEISIFTRLD